MNLRWKPTRHGEKSGSSRGKSKVRGELLQYIVEVGVGYSDPSLYKRWYVHSSQPSSGLHGSYSFQVMIVFSAYSTPPWSRFR
jgi:hypothetical protein